MIVYVEILIVKYENRDRIKRNKLIVEYEVKRSYRTNKE